jgi:hypothetical protein
MSYCEAMEAAGAKVLEYETFGSYQGDWWAKVVFEGKCYWVHGSYGSCSGCDSFQGHFGYGEHDRCGEHQYEDDDCLEVLACADCKEAPENYRKELANFGRSYLTGNEYTQEEAEKQVGPQVEWDEDGNAEQLAFLKAHTL